MLPNAFDYVSATACCTTRNPYGGFQNPVKITKPGGASWSVSTIATAGSCCSSGGASCCLLFDSKAANAIKKQLVRLEDDEGQTSHLVRRLIRHPESTHTVGEVPLGSTGSTITSWPESSSSAPSQACSRRAKSRLAPESVAHNLTQLARITQNAGGGFTSWDGSDRERPGISSFYHDSRRA